MGVNAQTSVPVFTSGQVLTAQQQTEINTGIPVFATTVTRDAAFGGSGEKTLAEGQVCYLEDSNRLQVYDGGIFRPIDVGFNSYTPTVTAGSGSFTTVSALGAFGVYGLFVYVQFRITITTNGSAATDVRFTTPFNVQNLTGGGSVGSARDSGITGNILNVIAISPTQLGIVTATNTYPGQNGAVLSGFATSRVQ